MAKFTQEQDQGKQGVFDSTLFTDESLAYSLSQMDEHKELMLTGPNGLDEDGVVSALELMGKLAQVIKEHPNRSTGVVLHALDCVVGVMASSALDNLQIAVMADMVKQSSRGLSVVASAGTLSAMLGLDLDEKNPAAAVRKASFQRRTGSGDQSKPN